MTSAGTGKRLKLARFILPLLLLSAAPYYPALKAGYLNWDDAIHTADNPLIRDFSFPALKKILTGPRHANYHPLTDISLALEAAAFGESAAVHHSGNLLLHSLNACLLFLFILGLTGGPWPAFLAALLWAVHPAQAESVCWIAERKNLLYSFFSLAALLAYLRHMKAPGRGTLAAVSGLFLAALLSKASAVTLPFVFLLLDICLKVPFGRRSLIEKVSFFLVAGAFAILSALAQGDTGGGIITANPVTLLSFYLTHTFWPVNLYGLYPYAETLRHIAGNLALYLAPAALFAVALWTAFRKDRLASLGLLWYLFNLLPFLLLVPVGSSLAADRYLYLPLAGMALAAAAAAGSPTRTANSRTGIPLTMAALAAGLMLSSATVSRSAAWGSSLAFWNDVARGYPEDSTVLLNLAAANLEEKNYAAAEELLRSLLRKEPQHHKALYNLGTLYGMSGRLAEAEELLRRSLAVKPDDAPAWSNLGRTQLAQGRPAEARKALLTAISADPAYAPAYASLAETGLKLGMKEEAARHQERYRALSGKR